MPTEPTYRIGGKAARSNPLLLPSMSGQNISSGQKSAFRGSNNSQQRQRLRSNIGIPSYQIVLLAVFLFLSRACNSAYLSFNTTIHCPSYFVKDIFAIIGIFFKIAWQQFFLYFFQKVCKLAKYLTFIGISVSKSQEITHFPASVPNAGSMESPRIWHTLQLRK